MVDTVVAAAVCTFRRPEMLRACLRSLATQSVCDDPDVQMRVVVVDNDPKGSSLVVRPEAEMLFGAALDWHREPEQGIAHARNRAVRAAERADFIAFIDDDEEAVSGWLHALLATQRRFAADVVCGPVMSRPDPDAPGWWTEMDALRRAQLDEGATLAVARTGNILFAVEHLRRYEGPFNVNLGKIGGEDSELSMRMVADGVRIIWSADAIVTECVPIDRMRLGWLLRRQLRGHSAWSLLEHEILGRHRSGRAVRSSARLVLGLGRSIWAVIRGRRAVVYAGLLEAAGGIGGLVGAVGYSFEEYGGRPRWWRPVRVNVSRG